MMSSMSAIATFLSLAVLPLTLQVTSVPEAAPAEVAAPEVTVDPQLVEGEARAQLLNEVSAAFGEVKTIQGRFHQINPDGTEATGQFYLRRPGRVRFEYDAPNPILIVSDGTTVSFEDKDLETQDRVPLRATPLALLLDDAIDFETKAKVTEVRKANGLVSIVLESRDEDTEGTLALILEDEGYGLVEWRTIDAYGELTLVELAGIETGKRINPRLFRIEELGEEDERD